jgi:hypothetical protein
MLLYTDAVGLAQERQDAEIEAAVAAAERHDEEAWMHHIRQANRWAGVVDVLRGSQ